ncbi:MAG: 4Fe-4S dicluster domain-containing protein [Planctomycetota bacterium]
MIVLGERFSLLAPHLRRRRCDGFGHGAPNGSAPGDRTETGSSYNLRDSARALHVLAGFRPSIGDVAFMPPSPAAPAASSVNFGFVIDNRRCIGCHACTVACKTEHSDPIGINKTWVTYIEKGIFPDASRRFHVMRCNHCADAPCVEICPTASLITREDGIVDFDSDRCIGCKACMQACPYDALTINPDSGTATKCNYCSHRVDSGRLPACVVVCPAEAIIAGDLNQPNSKIAHIVATEKTSSRKPEKGTVPNLFYVDGDRAALRPDGALRSTTTIWGSRPEDGVDAVSTVDAWKDAPRGTSKRSYDIAQRHAASWGWKVSAYLFTKSIAAGVVLIPTLLAWFGQAEMAEDLLAIGIPTAFVALAITGVLLVADLKRPERFLWVLLRPQWKSWLVRGAYGITGYGGFLTAAWFWPPAAGSPGGLLFLTVGGLLAAFTAAYSGWLFGQAKGRDLWQSPLAPIHLLVQSVLAGVAMLLLLDPMSRSVLTPLFGGVLVLNGVIVGVELLGRHATQDAKRATQILSTGIRGQFLWLGVVLAGHLLPLLALTAESPGITALAAIGSLVGLVIYEHLWVDAPQRVPLA